MSVALSAFVSAQLALADTANVVPPASAPVVAASSEPSAPAIPATDATTAANPAPATPPPSHRVDTGATARRHGRILSTITITTTDATVEYGQRITLAGAVTPAASSAYVVETRSGGSWTSLATGTTAADGTWSTNWTPSGTTVVRVRLADSSATSTPITITMRPRIVIRSIGRAQAFVGVRVVARISPSSYAGRVAFAVHYAGKVRATVAQRPTSGKLIVTIPNNGVGSLPVSVVAPAYGHFARTTKRFAVGAPVRALGIGSRGPDVAALLRRMRYLNFHTPSTTKSYSMPVGEVVMAFHKAHRMARTYSVDRATWKAIATASPMRPRFATPARHIEVDKTRQIMMLVRYGKVIGTLHVSTGATGNTPVGRWNIYQKGGSHLYQFMAFVGNYGIHGYVPVPEYPASHGCVREPMWAAAWTYDHTDYGDEVHIYT